MLNGDNLNAVITTNNIIQDGLYEKLVSSSPGYALVIDSDCNKLLYYDNRFCERSGYTPLQLEDSAFSFLDLFDTKGRERFLMQIQFVTLYNEFKTKYSTYRLNTQAGHIGVWYIYASPIKMPGMDDACYHLYLLPELSKNNIPFQSFDSRELFFQQFRQFEFGTYEWIIGSGKVFWSDGIYDIYEIDKTAPPLSYEFIRQFTHPDDRTRVGAIVQHAVEAKNSFDIEMRIVTAKQKVKTIHSMGKMVVSQNGEAVKFVGSIRDITRQKQIEFDLQHHVEELSRSNKELEEFAYVASHDLQEPLRKITTFSGRLGEKYSDVLTGEGIMYMERIIASAENMRMLINNLLEFSRIARDTQPFEKVNLNFILHQVKSDLELSIEENKVTVEADKLPDIEASVSQMKQLFTNIINNAIKFRRPDVLPQIVIKSLVLDSAAKQAHGLAETHDFYQITIADNGIGFDNEYANKIFQIFQRLHGKADYPGSGIGLAICKKIIDHHHGLIFAEGSEGNGAVFTFILPAKQH